MEQAVTQPRPARHWLTAKRLRRYPCAVLLLYLGIVAVGCYRAYWLHTVTMPTLHEDFAAFWSAGWLAVHGHALDAYDAHLLTQIEWQALHRQIAGVLPWLYPPTALFWFSPFSLLPYDTAAVVFLAFNVAAFVALAYATVPDPRTPLVALAFPGIVITLLSGQNGLLTAVLAGLGLLLLERRPAAAGCCFALLAFKPQLAVLIPLALLCARQWRALAACAVAFGLNWAAALLVFGPQTLPAFLHNLGEGAAYVSSGRYKLYRLPSFFVTAKLLHAPIALAYALQALSALTGAAAVIYAWGKPCPYALRAAVLICATLLVSPYLYDYDLTWYGILIAWYCRYALQAGFRRGEREWLIVLWSAPELGPLLAGTLSFQFMPFLALATLWMLVRRVGAPCAAREFFCFGGVSMTQLRADDAHAARPLVSIVTPFYNEGLAIDAFFAELAPIFDAIPEYRFEIVCIDDGSRDDTAARLAAAAARDPRVRVFELTRNFGKEAALTAGLDHARGDAVIPLDADLQDPPQLIPLMLERWREGAEVVVAKRRDRTSDSFAKRATAIWFYRLHNALSELKIPENVGDFRLMDRQVVDALRELPERHRFMKGLFAWVGFRTVLVEYQRASRVAGRTKFSGWRLWNFALEGITSFSTAPLRIWTYIGGAIALIAFGYGGFIALRTILFGNPVAGYPSLITIMLFMAGIQLIGIGVVGEYIGRIYDETKRRPVYLVRRGGAGEVSRPDAEQ